MYISVNLIFMNFIVYVNYKFYERFLRQDNSEISALFSSVSFAPLPFFLNLFVLLNLWDIAICPIPYLRTGSRTIYLTFYLALLLINYFYIYFDKRYLKLFSIVKRKEIKWLFPIYFWASLILVILSFYLRQQLIS